MTRFLPLLELGVIAAIVTLACFHPVHTAMIVRWVLAW